MDDEDLQKLVEQISLQNFSMPFQHKASFNTRLRTVGGRYVLNTGNLEFNSNYFIEYGREELIKVIKHELCHYHLHLTGKGYKHRDSSFKACLKEVNAPRYSLPTSQRKSMPLRYKIVCKSCNQVYYRKKRIHVDKYRCGKCGGALELYNIN